MDYVELRLASDDEQAVHHLISRLRATFPEMRFQRVKVGRDGDWLCYGTYDEGAVKFRDSHQHMNTSVIDEWIHTFDTVVRPMLAYQRKTETLIDLLDDSISHLMRWLRTR